MQHWVQDSWISAPLEKYHMRKGVMSNSHVILAILRVLLWKYPWPAVQVIARQDEYGNRMSASGEFQRININNWTSLWLLIESYKARTWKEISQGRHPKSVNPNPIMHLIDFLKQTTRCCIPFWFNSHTWKESRQVRALNINSFFNWVNIKSLIFPWVSHGHSLLLTDAKVLLWLSANICSGHRS